MTDQAPAQYAGPQRVLSGVQPTGDLHLGNYLGALVKFARLQHEMDTFIFVADLHAITVWQDPALLTAQTREIAAAYLASGLDPEKAIIFPQSAVRAHAELAWIFNCVARLGWLDRMTQFKEKSGKHKERSSVGLYTYPVLQAADILLYKATEVPTGEDQKQHLELTRDIAAKFNNDFGVPGFFPLPDPLTQGPAPRVMSLRDGSAKMSKSDPSDQSRINLTDDADTIVAKIRKARTDPDALPDGSVHRHDVTGPQGAALRVLERAVYPAGQPQPMWRLLVAADRSVSAQAVTRFGHVLGLSLAVLWALLVAAAWAQVTVGLAPNAVSIRFSHSGVYQARASASEVQR